MGIYTDSPVLHIKGHSGCHLSIIMGNNDSWIVRKKAGIKEYNDRLVKQIEKQRKFLCKDFSDNIIIPDIVCENYDDNGLFFCDMSYIRGYKFSDYISKVSVKELFDIYKCFERYLDYLYKYAVKDVVSKSKIIDKISDVKKKIEVKVFFEKQFIDCIEKYLIENIPNVRLSIGQCHGDLTFSNIIIVSPSSFCFIDLLDSFIESPVVDIVKLRQDTKFGWSLMLDDDLPGYKKNRCFQVYSYLDGLFNGYVNDMDNEDNVWYKYLEVFNLYRIMPYVDSVKVRMFIYENIKKLIYL